ncbi:MAG: hypothetical protein ACRCSI_07830, partial [Eubacterium aggregans]
MNDELLVQILAELRKQNQPALGFGFAPRPRRIYANRQYADCLWYFWNGSTNEHEPINFHALTGYITQVEVEEKEFRGKPDIKLNIHVKADRLYLIQAGIETLFSKGVIYALKEVTDFSQVLSIAVEPGKTEQVLFGRVYVGNQVIYAPYDEEDTRIPWRSLAESIQSQIEAGGQSVKVSAPDEMPPAEFSGQGKLIQEQAGGIVDQLNAEIRGLDQSGVAAMGRRLEESREALGVAYDVVLKHFKVKVKTLGPVINRADVLASVG